MYHQPRETNQMLHLIFQCSFLSHKAEKGNTFNATVQTCDAKASGPPRLAAGGWKLLWLLSSIKKHVQDVYRTIYIYVHLWGCLFTLPS